MAGKKSTEERLDPETVCHHPERERERQGPEWTPSGRLPGLTEQFLNRRLFQGEGILGGGGVIMRLLPPDPAWCCPSLRNRPMVEGILQTLEYLRGLPATPHPTQSTLAPPKLVLLVAPPGTYLQQLHGPFVFPLSFCLGLQVGGGKMLEGKDEEWGWDRGRCKGG